MKFYQCILRHPKRILVLFSLAAIIGLFLKPLIAVNYNIVDYLPRESSSTISLDLMKEEFTEGIPNARVMIYQVTVPQALAYKEQLEQCEGVTEVLWLDDAADIYQPLESMDQDVLDSYYKNNHALYTVTIAEDQIIPATEAIRDVIGEDNVMTGDAVSTALATTSTVNEIKLITAFAILFVFLVLILTTASWLEPVLILVGLGIAIAINSGSNLIFGEISFVTNAAGNVLQMAVSLDYSVFLLHRFEELRENHNAPRQAMAEALVKSTSSILSSGLTTVIGFFALIFMQFEIGPDLGIALAKGVMISLITVFLFFPVLVLTCYQPLEKLRHRPFLPPFRRFAKGVSRVMIPVACALVLIMVPAYLASNANHFYYGASHIFGNGTQFDHDTRAIETVYGKSDTYVLMVPNDSLPTEEKLSRALRQIPEVKSIISYADTVGAEIPKEYLDDETLAQLDSGRYSRLVLTVNADYEGAETFSLVKNIRETANRYYPDQYYLAGEGISTYDLMTTITADTVKVNAIAIGAVFLVLLLTMKSLLLPILLVLAIETAIWINLSIPYFSGSNVFYISYLIISSIQLGATVDYAILFTDRYLEFRQNMEKKTAVIQTISTVTVSVLTSGIVLTVVGFLMGGFSSHGILAQLGTFLGQGGLLSLTVVLFALPGLLYLTDPLIERTTRHAHFYHSNTQLPKEEQT